MDGGTASEAGEASSSHARAGYTGAALVPPAPHPTPVTHPVAPAGHTGDVLAPNGPIVQLPHDSIAVEWWLARRAIEGYGAMPYTTDGVLALWPERRHETDRWTFGLEFEFATADAQWVAAELHARGLTASPEPDEYHGERTRGYWTVEQDHSVTSVFSGGESGATYVVGGEIVSPPLRDTPETWRQVATVLEVLRACGAEVNRSCGLHVHVGVEALLERDEGRKACPELAEGTKDGGSFDLRSST